MKTIKKYQTGSEVKGSKGGKASQIIAGISAAAVGAAGIGKNISNRRKAKKAAQEKAKMEAAGKMKYGGAKKPLRKKQSGGMSGPLTESDSNDLDLRYPSTSRVRIPAAPKDYDSDNFNPGYGFNIDPIENEMKNRQYSEKGTRASRDFNTGSVYKKGGATKSLKKAQYGTEFGKSTTKKNIFGRTKVTTPETGNYREGSTSKGISTNTYDSKGNYVKNKTKFTTTNPDGNSQTMVIKKKKGPVHSFGNVRRGIIPVKKTGGMVNSNSKVTALKVAGSKGVKSGVNSKVSASKVAKGRTGGTSSAPKTATPKAKMGGNMKKKSC